MWINKNRTSLLIPALVLALLSMFVVPASAAAISPEAVMLYKDSVDTVYIGESNLIYTTNSPMPLCEMPARSLVYADDARVLFTTGDVENQGDFPLAQCLWLLSLHDGDAAGNLKPQLITSTAGDVVYIPQDGLAYYIDQQDDASLMGISPVLGTTRVVTTLAQTPSALTPSIDGLILGAAGGDQLFVLALCQFVEAPTPTTGMTVNIGSARVYETLIDMQGNLSLRVHGQGASQAKAVDSEVIAAVPHSGTVYYLKNMGDGPVLMSYDYATNTCTTIGRFRSAMLPEIAAAGSQVFLISEEGKIFSMDTDSHVVSEFAVLGTLPALPSICASDDILLVYDASGQDGNLRFVTSYPLIAEEIEDAPIIEPAEATARPQAEIPAEPTAPPAQPHDEDTQPTVLTRGSRGDDVMELQEILKRLGYPVGKPDGIYGSGTADAVKYLQYDMGVRESGTVSMDFLLELRTSRDLPKYARFVEMTRGDNGIRVYDLQARLHALGWLSSKPNGNFGPETEKAVTAFSEHVGITKHDNRATVAMLKQLFAKGAPKAPTPQQLEPTAPPNSPKQDKEITEDDLIELCRFLNDRFPGGNYNKVNGVYKLQSALHKLGYLKKSERSKVYDSKTFSAVKHFQKDNGIHEHGTGKPDKMTLESLFPEVGDDTALVGGQRPIIP